MGLARGDLATVAIGGDYGKPRPALVIQDDAFAALNSITMLCLTSELRDLPLFRIGLEPSAENGLRRRSQVMVDKAVSVPRARIGDRIGHIDRETMRRVDRALVRFLGLE